MPHQLYDVASPAHGLVPSFLLRPAVLLPQTTTQNAYKHVRSALAVIGFTEADSECKV